MIRAREKWLRVEKHAIHGMASERPPIGLADLQQVLEEPDSDDEHQALTWIATRTVIVYYEAYEEEIHVESVSATRNRLPP